MRCILRIACLSRLAQPRDASARMPLCSRPTIQLSFCRTLGGCVSIFIGIELVIDM